MAVTPDTLPRSTGLALPVWAPLALVVALSALWMVTFDSGFASDAVAGTGAFLHEFFHDGRHLLGVPCH